MNLKEDGGVPIFEFLHGKALLFLTLKIDDLMVTGIITINSQGNTTQTSCKQTEQNHDLMAYRDV
jgi:hypothetical protein